jgi:hypothetical protein
MPACQDRNMASLGKVVRHGSPLTWRECSEECSSSEEQFSS